MKKNLLKFFILIILIAVPAYYFYQFKHNHKEQEYLTLYGNVDIRQVNLSFRVAGRISKMIFEEGDTVKKGQVISILDSKPYLDNFSKALAELGNAKANYLKYKNGTRPQDKEIAKSTLAEKEAAFENAFAVYSRENCVKNVGSISAQEFDKTENQKKAADAQLKTAKQQLNLALEGFRYEDVLAAKAQVAVAKASLESTKTQLSDTKILAPTDGIILTRIQEPGAIVAEGAPVYTLSLFKPVWIRTYVSEKDLGNIYPGMKAEVFTDTRPDKPYYAQIGFISPVAEFTPKNIETTELRTDLVYRLRVIINNPDYGLRQGMPVTVKLKLKRQGRFEDPDFAPKTKD
ncbi:MAG: secretion protein HlyD [Candidatus Gastranaerophilaceae bacterium]|jgi:HlyD family secretion protein